MIHKYQAMGDAISKAININTKKSLDSNRIIMGTEAPSTFLIPISFVLFTAASAANPNKPRHARKIEMPPAHPTMLLHFSSDL